jgi:hypothetical protein
MTFKNIAILAIVVLVIVFGGWYVLSHQSSSGTPVTQGSGSDTSDSSGTNSGSQTGGTSTSSGSASSLRSVISRGGNYTCTLTVYGNSGQTTGTVYSSANPNKTRMDLNVIASSGTRVTTHIIRSGGYSYTWVDGQTVGQKAAITSSSPIVPQPSGNYNTVTDDANISSDCHPWAPVASEFVAPSSITFVSK